MNNPLHTCQHQAKITQSRLSTTADNLLTFIISKISSNNSEKLSLLANKHLWTFLSHASYASSRRMQSHALGGDHIRPDFTSEKYHSPTCLLSSNSFDFEERVPEAKDFVVTLEKPAISYLSVSARIRVIDPFSQMKPEYLTTIRRSGGG